MPNMAGLMRNHDTLSIPIYYYKNLIAYKLFYTIIKKWDKDGNIADKEEQYQLFVFEKGSKKGYLYDSYSSQKSNVVPVDSMITDVIWCEQNSAQYYKTFERNFVELLSSDKSADNSMLHETYSYRRKGDSTAYGTFKLVFTSKLQNIPFSMSRELDSIKGMKLIGTSAEGYFQYPKNGVIIKDTATSKDFMREVTLSPNDSLEIMQYFDRYLRDKNKQ
jgi:hypothetical protein